MTPAIPMEATALKYPKLFQRIDRSIKRLLKKHKIKVFFKRFQTNVGWAMTCIRTIRIPRLIDIASAYVIYHEIAHVIFDHYSNPKRRNYLQELEAEKYALRMIRRFSIHKLFPEIYNDLKEDAMAYVIKFILQEIEKGAKCEDISPKAYEFIKPMIDLPAFLIIKKKKKVKKLLKNK